MEKKSRGGVGLVVRVVRVEKKSSEGVELVRVRVRVRVRGKG